MQLDHVTITDDARTNVHAFMKRNQSHMLMRFNALTNAYRLLSGPSPQLQCLLDSSAACRGAIKSLLRAQSCSDEAAQVGNRSAQFASVLAH